MKSVGEAMAIGRTIHESLQKALASMETGLTGFDEIAIVVRDTDGGADLRRPIRAPPSPGPVAPDPDRIRVIAQAMRLGMSDDDIHAVTAFDPWFLARIREIVESRGRGPLGRPADRTPPACARSSDGLHRRPARHADGADRGRRAATRMAAGVVPQFKRIDTCAAEFEAQTPYMYSTYETPVMGDGMRSRPTDAKKVVILGGGPNRIGQGIEFDYCCCHACFALSAAGYETIMVNCNPETVSTDYDTSDRLYFEPLTFEHVMEILRVEQENGTLHGVIVQFGGQTPLKLAGRAARGRHPDPGHHARRHRPGRGSRAFPAACPRGWG